MDKSSKLTLPLLPLRDMVIFPYVTATVFIGREKSINALEKIISNKTDFALVLQKEARINDPTLDQIYEIGTLASIVKHLKLPNGTAKIILEGQKRVRIKKYVDTKNCLVVEVEPLIENSPEGTEAEALLRTAYTSVENYARLNKYISSEFMDKISKIDNCGELADVIASQLNLRFEDKQKILEIVDSVSRLKEVLRLME